MVILFKVLEESLAIGDKILVFRSVYQITGFSADTFIAEEATEMAKLLNLKNLLKKS